MMRRPSRHSSHIMKQVGTRWQVRSRIMSLPDSLCVIYIKQSSHDQPGPLANPQDAACRKTSGHIARSGVRDSQPLR